MSYIHELRAALGQRPLVLAGVSVLVIDDARPGEILLQRRSDNGQWSNPGGMIEPGESAEETAIREVIEESGYGIEAPTLVTVISGKESHHVYPNGDEVYNVTILFIARVTASQGSGMTDAETIGLQWFPFSRLPDDLSPPTRRVPHVAAQLEAVRERILRRETQ
jgi:8-oxo-dGTP pyrophosphatase MutT (NUDIX family)